MYSSRSVISRVSGSVWHCLVGNPALSCQPGGMNDLPSSGKMCETISANSEREEVHVLAALEIRGFGCVGQ